MNKQELHLNNLAVSKCADLEADWEVSFLFQCWRQSKESYVFVSLHGMTYFVMFDCIIT